MIFLILALVKVILSEELYDCPCRFEKLISPCVQLTVLTFSSSCTFSMSTSYSSRYKYL
ncbi:hypothetical protein O6H91_Y576700 [Diphasiastrum complanatum]|nr:hypothetical protein O6H91_Y576700 [Diphasiastrum complanatum]